MVSDQGVDLLGFVCHGDNSPAGRRWGDGIVALWKELLRLDRGSTTSPVGVGIAFCVPMPLMKGETFVAGPSGAWFDRKYSAVDMLFGLPESPPDDVRGALLGYLEESVTYAEAWGRRTKRAPDGLPEVRALLERLRTAPPAPAVSAPSAPAPATVPVLPRATLEDLGEPPWLRATPEHGEAWDDPSEDLLFELLTDIEDGDAGSSLVVTRLSDPAGTTFARARRHDDGSYHLEYRDGGPDLWVTTAEDMRDAHELLTAWSFMLPDQLATTTWTRHPIES